MSDEIEDITLSLSVQYGRKLQIKLKSQVSDKIRSDWNTMYNAIDNNSMYEIKSF